MPPAAPKLSRRAKLLIWAIAGLGLLALGVGVLLVLAVLQGLDSDRDLSDFASPSEARAFTSAHLPAPLPNDAVVEELHYERWTDWRFTARVRLSSPEASEQYIEQAKERRDLNDQYCSNLEPPAGARYFLRPVSACGSVRRASAQVVEVACNTR